MPAREATKTTAAPAAHLRAIRGTKAPADATACLATTRGTFLSVEPATTRAKLALHPPQGATAASPPTKEPTPPTPAPAIPASTTEESPSAKLAATPAAPALHHQPSALPAPAPHTGLSPRTPAPAIEATTTLEVQLAADATTAAIHALALAPTAPHVLQPGIGSSQATNASAAFASTKRGSPYVPLVTTHAVPVQFPRLTAPAAFTLGIGACQEIPVLVETPTTRTDHLQCARPVITVAHHAKVRPNVIPAPQVCKGTSRVHPPTAFAETDTSTPASRPVLNVTIPATDAQGQLPINAPHATHWPRGPSQEPPATA